MGRVVVAGRGRRVGQRLPGATSRWNRGKDLSWEPLRAERVVEVAYDHLQGDRFRHGTTFERWRPDKPPADCRYAQLEETPAYEIAQDLRCLRSLPDRPGRPQGPRGLGRAGVRSSRPRRTRGPQREQADDRGRHRSGLGYHSHRDCDQDDHGAKRKINRRRDPSGGHARCTSAMPRATTRPHRKRCRARPLRWPRPRRSPPNRRHRDRIEGAGGRPGPPLVPDRPYPRRRCHARPPRLYDACHSSLEEGCRRWFHVTGTSDTASPG